MLIDSHCHLDFPGLVENIDAVMERAEEAGLDRVVTISTRITKMDQILKIAESHGKIFCSVGTHPHNATEERDLTLEDILKHTDHPKVVGIGEAGLDYHYDHGDPVDQAAGFRRHIEAARLSNLPLIIHSRDADDDMGNILEEEYAKGAFPFLMHCFTASKHLAERAIALGGYVSFSGVLTFKKSDELRSIAAALPDDRILVETDSPYLAPHPLRGKPNEPAYVKYTAEVLASVKGVDLYEIGKITSENFYRLFNKVPQCL